MRRHELILSAIALLAPEPWLWAEEKLVLPGSPQPRHAIASMDKDGVITLRAKVTSYREELRQGAGGQAEIVRVPFEETRVSRGPSKDVQVFRAHGK